MKRWNGKVAIVTGASTGIGAAIAQSLVSHGVKVIGISIKMEEFREILQEIKKDKFFPLECDVTKEEDILKTFKWVEKEFEGADILVNNAGILNDMMVIDSSTEEHRKIVDTNFIGPTIFSREFIRSLKKRNAPGHIINMCSVTGLYPEAIQTPCGLYPATKSALRFLGIELRHEINICKLNIKVTNISPGFVLTNLVKDLRTQAINTKLVSSPQSVGEAKLLKPQDIADTVICVLDTPEGVEIAEVALLAQNFKYM